MSSNNKATHTPGPWCWLSGGHITTTAGPDWASHTIATVKNDGPDARLIATAPELYEVLNEILTLLILADKELSKLTGLHGKYKNLPSVSKAFQALARAGGEEESND